MTQPASLWNQIYAQYHAPHQTIRDMDRFAEKILKGKTVKAHRNARLVMAGKITTRHALKVTAVMNQGFNGQVAAVQTRDGRRFQISLADLAAR